MKKIGRNEPCPCGSGKKYKKCCLGKLGNGHPFPASDSPLCSNDNLAKINRFIMEGYDYLEVDEYDEACKCWNEAWNILVPLISSDVTDVCMVNKLFDLCQDFSNWYQDFDDALFTAAFKDPQWYSVKAAFARTIQEMFPDSEEIYLVNISRSEAEAMTGMGDLEKADKLFQALAERFPSNEWVYIGWGDLYGILRPKGQPLQYERAKAIYEMGLDRCSRKSHMGLLERLSDLEAESATLPEETND